MSPKLGLASADGAVGRSHGTAPGAPPRRDAGDRAGWRDRPRAARALRRIAREWSLRPPPRTRSGRRGSHDRRSPHRITSDPPPAGRRPGPRPRPRGWVRLRGPSRCSRRARQPPGPADRRCRRPLRGGRARGQRRAGDAARRDWHPALGLVHRHDRQPDGARLRGRDSAAELARRHRLPGRPRHGRSCLWLLGLGGDPALERRDRADPVHRDGARPPRRRQRGGDRVARRGPRPRARGSGSDHGPRTDRRAGRDAPAHPAARSGRGWRVRPGDRDHGHRRPGHRRPCRLVLPRPPPLRGRGAARGRWQRATRPVGRAERRGPRRRGEQPAPRHR